MAYEIGRNDPCPCRSGKKYKKCCLHADEASKVRQSAYLSNGTLADLDSASDEPEIEARVWAEHPEYTHLLEAGQETAPDGTNYRLHIMLHSIVEKQLADNSPPEAAEALRRLTDTGADRHDTVHAIGDLVVELLWTTLKNRKPADVESYRRALSRLGC